MNTIICNSGGAYGADKQFQDLCEIFNIKCNAWYMGERSKFNAPYGNIHISSQDEREGRVKSANASKAMFWTNYSQMKDERLIRNWAQVKYSKQVFAVSKFAYEGDKPSNKFTDTRTYQKQCVAGGTGYAVEMAILEGNREVYLFNQTDNKWYEYNFGLYKWVLCQNLPVITQSFAGIGSRNITEQGRLAIIDLFERSFTNTFKPIKPIEEEPMIEQKIVVVNVRDNINPNYKYIYCGRGSYPNMLNGNLGNPFTVEQYGRGNAIFKYIDWLYGNSIEAIQYKERLLNLIETEIKPIYGKQTIALACWCKPNNCHCDFLKWAIEDHLNK